MKLLPRLVLGMSALVAAFAIAGGLTWANLRQMAQAQRQVEAQVKRNDLALAYRHGCEEAALGASQLAFGNPMGEQRVREGLTMMEQSREALRTGLSSEPERREFGELERTEALVRAATLRISELVATKSDAREVRQQLAFLSARSDALSLRLEALFDASRDALEAQLVTTRLLGLTVEHQTQWSIVAALLLALGVSSVLFRSIARPLSRLHHGVVRIEKGELDHVIAEAGKDEIGQLTHAFNGMTSSLRGAMNALDLRNLDMRAVLDHVGQGLIMLDLSAQPSMEHSSAAPKLLGEILANEPIWKTLEGLDPRTAIMFEACWDQVVLGLLPLEITLEQLPKKAHGQGRYLEFEYLPIRSGELLSKILMVVTDATERVAAEEAHAKDQETLAIFTALEKNRQAFVDFFSEGSELIGGMQDPTSTRSFERLRRDVHTMKGNALLFQLNGVARLCHSIEDEMAESGSVPVEGLDRLRSRWTELREYVERWTTDGGAARLGSSELDGLLKSILGGMSRRDVAKKLAEYRQEPLEERFKHLGEQARALTRRLGKGELQFICEAQGVRLPRERFAPFWNALVHAIRNAVDHGLESPDERETAGKGPPQLRLSAMITQDELWIELADDGAGIAWEAVRGKAKSLGLPHASDEDLVRALFADGMSTAGEVTDVSGRGVGMGALGDATSALGGRITVQSVRGQGTVFAFRFPSQVALDARLVELSPSSHLNSLLPSGAMFSVPPLPAGPAVNQA